MADGTAAGCSKLPRSAHMFVAAVLHRPFFSFFSPLLAIESAQADWDTDEDLH